MQNKRTIVVVGGLAAGPSAAAKAVRTNPKSEVILYEMSDTVSYGICEATYAIAGIIPDEKSLEMYSPEKLRLEKKINVRTLHMVERIIPTQHKILVRDLSNRSQFEQKYDKLVIATGSRPRKLNIMGEDARNVFHLSSRQDTINILKYLEQESPKKGIIIGGGYIAMELAEALKTRGLDVTLIHRFRLPMEGLETETREIVVQELEKNNVRFIPNTRIEGFHLSPNRKVDYVITNRGSFEADIVLLSLGVEPNVDLAKSAKVRLGYTGAIIVDERQRTNIDDIYAAGDCCEVKNVVNGSQMYLPLASIACRTGWVAGENAAGGNAVFKGAIRAIAVKVFGLEVAQVGLSSEEAKDSRFQLITESISTYDKASVFPDCKKITIKLLADQRTKRIVGANVYGGEGVVHRANVLGIAIQHRLSIDDVARFDMIYSPQFAPLWDAVLVAANQMKKKLSS